MKQANATEEFLGDTDSWGNAKIELEDVHGLWGGRRIRVEGSGRVIVQSVEPSMLERKYEFKAGAEEARSLLDLFVEVDFVSIRPDERMGIPDERRPVIRLKSGNGQRREVSKWAGVKDERFEKLYTALIGVERRARQQKPVQVGTFDPGARGDP